MGNRPKNCLASNYDMAYTDLGLETLLILISISSKLLSPTKSMFLKLYNILISLSVRAVILG